MPRVTLPLVLLLAAAVLLLALVPGATAQFNTECGVGETQLKMKVGGTDKLTKCTDFFDAVDPYAIVTAGSDRLGIQKTTGRLDNTDTPKWDAMLDFGCVEENSRLSFRVKDWDYFGDETCLGPLSIIEEWPPSGQPALICEEEAINGMGTGCVSFALFYGADAAEAAASGLEIPPVPGTSPTAETSTTTSPFMTPTTPSQSPVVEAPGVPPSTEPATTVPTPPRNTTRPPPPPPAQPRKADGPTGGSGNGTATTKRPPVVGAPAPTIEDGPAEEERAKSARRSKGAAVAGGVITSLALVGAAVGVYASRRRRREEGHAQGLDLEDPSAGRTAGDAPGSVAVL